MLKDPCKLCIVRASCNAGCQDFLAHQSDLRVFVNRFTLWFSGITLTASVSLFCMSIIYGNAETHPQMVVYLRYFLLVVVLGFTILNTVVNGFILPRKRRKIENRFNGAYGIQPVQKMRR